MIGSSWGKLRSFLADLFLIRRENPDFVCVHFLTARYASLMLLLSRPCILTCWGSDILVDLPASRSLGLALRRAGDGRRAGRQGQDHRRSRGFSTSASHQLSFFCMNG